MSENLILLSSFDTIRKKFNVPNIEINEPITKRLISGDEQAWVLKAGFESLSKMKFGFTPEYAPKKLDMLNLRTDQFQHDKDETKYDRLHFFFNKSGYYRQLIGSRCVVFVDAFLVTSPDNTTYLIHMQNHERPFVIAAIHDHWLNFNTGLYETGFAIITAAANPMLKRIGIEHMPVILTQKNASFWLNEKEDRKRIIELIHTYPDENMNGYPVSGKIFSENVTNELLQPIGEKINRDQKSSK
jgi:putative SOS response-associated peptidase YedK